ncbi:MAG: polyphosphate polymerase domain-containing protein [Lachnospiraceae bacterium]|nr:polyphosphate polymerase domain-containing protein [Lachnospiraceae bacterium]
MCGFQENDEMTGRKELKFLCDDRTLIQVENRIKGVMKRDIHQDGDSYEIRSIYFDSPSDRCYYENQSGTGTRSKYRIRIYNCDGDYIRAEVKSKYYDTTKKVSTKISRDQFKLLKKRGSLEMLFTGENRDATALKQFADKVYAEGFSPAAIVRYDRSAYTYSPCNVRVTFDRNISACTAFDHFFDPAMPARPVCEPGIHVLEVKYDEFLPDHICTLLMAGDMRRTSFSKYYMARNMLMGRT